MILTSYSNTSLHHLNSFKSLTNRGLSALGPPSLRIAHSTLFTPSPSPSPSSIHRPAPGQRRAKPFLLRFRAGDHKKKTPLLTYRPTPRSPSSRPPNPLLEPPRHTDPVVPILGSLILLLQALQARSPSTCGIPFETVVCYSGNRNSARQARRSASWFLFILFGLLHPLLSSPPPPLPLSVSLLFWPLSSKGLTSSFVAPVTSAICCCSYGI